MLTNVYIAGGTTFYKSIPHEYTSLDKSSSIWLSTHARIQYDSAQYGQQSSLAEGEEGTPYS
jgi:hypothetical protein